MADNKSAPDFCESQPPSLGTVRDIFAEFNVCDVSDDICTRVLDIIYRHTCDVVEEAQAVAHHSGKTKVEEEDVQLAINFVTDGLMFSPPYKDQLLAYSEKNEQPLPSIRPCCGIRLPAERFSLTAPNYSLLPHADFDKSNSVSELLGNKSMALHMSNQSTNVKNIFRSMPPNRSINAPNPLGPSSVHVIAPPGVGPSMLRVQNVQSLTQLPSVDDSRTLSVVSSVPNVVSLARRFTDTR